MESILTSIKLLLGVMEDYEHYDTDIIMHINTVFMILRQIGVGPEEGFSIKDKSTTWDEYVSADKIEAVKTYIYLKVRLIFDPPSSSIMVEAINRTISELEWRLNLEME